ncbi:MAG: hypothetical protein HQK60_00075 [Deltaproteobacteria bacterium]|nr:hypothetical protein [Deltaproteobacteria bacterium]
MGAEKVLDTKAVAEASILPQGKGSRVDLKTNEALCKMYLDLWLHQNSLMWGRLHVLWLVQVGFLSLSSYLYATDLTLHLSFLAKFASLLCALTTAGLGYVMYNDKKLRDIYRAGVEDCGLGLYPASMKRQSIVRDKRSLNGEKLFYIAIFVVFVFIDLYTAWIFSMRPATRTMPGKTEAGVVYIILARNQTLVIQRTTSHNPL